MVVVLLLFLLIAVCVYGAGRDNIDRRTASAFALPSLMGKWYEIARFDHSFERGMNRVTAEYAMRDDGMVDVLNSGVKGTRTLTARGRAKTTRRNGRLRVSFFRIFYFDYNIMEMGPRGEWMLVGSRSPRYLWILARTPSLPDPVVGHIVSLAESRGYNTENFIYVKQQ